MAIKTDPLETKAKFGVSYVNLSSIEQGDSIESIAPIKH